MMSLSFTKCPCTLIPLIIFVRSLGTISLASPFCARQSMEYSSAGKYSVTSNSGNACDERIFKACAYVMKTVNGLFLNNSSDSLMESDTTLKPLLPLEREGLKQNDRCGCPSS